MTEHGHEADAATELRSAAERVDTLQSDLADEGLDREELDTVADATGRSRASSIAGRTARPTGTTSRGT